MRIESYTPAIRSIIQPDRLPELGPGSPNRAMYSALAALTPENAFPKVQDRMMAMACISGLWLLHDFLDESHTISQDNPTSTGSYWHAVMHRREPDPSNSKYWWAQVGSHPVIDMLKTEAPKIGYKFTNPPDFVDICEHVRGSGSADEELAKRVQLLEWQLLFNWCFTKALPDSGH
jgi:hypothetical protein